MKNYKFKENKVSLLSGYIGVLIFILGFISMPVLLFLSAISSISVKDIIIYEEPFIGFYHEHQVDTETIVKKSVEITTDVAVKFAEWMDDNLQQRQYTPMLQMSTQKLFEEFINNYYEK
jgi:hypothetical protein